MTAPVGARLRFRFTKDGPVRFTSHRDVARAWERALRAAGLPVASTEGFSPRPKVHFGLALPTGAESDAEYLDVDLRPGAPVEPWVAASSVTAILPPGMDVTAAGLVDRRAPSLQEAVVACTWRLHLTPGPGLGGAVADLLARETIPVARERKGRVTHDDLRPAILAVDVPGPDVVVVELATATRGIRPGEFAHVLDPARPLLRARRLHQWIELDGARREPLPVDATRAPHAQVRAS